MVIETLSFHAILSGPEHKACLVQKAGCPACLENSGLSFLPRLLPLGGNTTGSGCPAPPPPPPRFWKGAPHPRLHTP